jgi:hypothetical protein
MSLIELIEKQELEIFELHGALHERDEVIARLEAKLNGLELAESGVPA